MKKYLFPLFLFFCNGLFAQQRIGPMEVFDFPDNYTIVNKIKALKIYNYKIGKSGIIDSTLKESLKYLYDNNGFLIRQDFGDEKDNPVRVISYTYNNTGSLSKQFIQNYKHKMGPMTLSAFNNYYEFEYDTVGHLISKYERNEDTTRLTITRFGYNDKGQITSITKKVDRGEYLPNYTLSYTELGNIDRVNRMTVRNKIDFTYIYKYYAADHSKKTFIDFGNGEELSEEDTYNINNQRVKYIYYKSGVPFSQKKYIYNTDGTIFSEITYRDGEVTETIRYYYQK